MFCAEGARYPIRATRCIGRASLWLCALYCTSTDRQKIKKIRKHKAPFEVPVRDSTLIFYRVLAVACVEGPAGICGHKR